MVWVGKVGDLIIQSPISAVDAIKTVPSVDRTNEPIGSKICARDTLDA